MVCTDIEKKTPLAAALVAQPGDNSGVVAIGFNTDHPKGVDRPGTDHQPGFAIAWPCAEIAWLGPDAMKRHLYGLAGQDHQRSLRRRIRKGRRNLNRCPSRRQQ